VTRILEGDPFDFLDLVEEWLDNKVLRYVLPAINDECRDSNEVQAIDDRPVLHDSGNMTIKKRLESLVKINTKK